jgi:tetratricopeptide (TPR) repeat protein
MAISLWETTGSREEYKRALFERIVNRAEKYQDKGYIKKAIDCYEGFCKQEGENQEIHNQLGSLYLEIGNQFKAGRHFYFKQNLTPEEAECVRIFEQKYGNNSVLIAKHLLNKESYSVSKLDNYSKQRLNELIQDATRQVGITPKFLRGAKQHFEKLNWNKKSE